MPIIPASWMGGETIVNATGLSGSGFPVYQFAKSLSITITELNVFIDLIGTCNESINRELSLDLIAGRVKLYWKNLNGDYTQVEKNDLNFGTNFVDFTLGQLGLSIKCSEITELFLVLRWDNNIEFSIYDPNQTPIELADNEISINSVINGSLTYQLDANGNPYVYYSEDSNWHEMPIKLYTVVGAIPGQTINIVINQGTAENALFGVIYYLSESDLSIPFTRSGSEWAWEPSNDLGNVISDKTNATLIPESNKFYKILVQDQFYSTGTFTLTTISP